MLVVFKYSFCSRKFSRCCVHLRQKRVLPGSGRTHFLGVKWMGVTTVYLCSLFHQHSITLGIEGEGTACRKGDIALGGTKLHLLSETTKKVNIYNRCFDY